MHVLQEHALATDHHRGLCADAAAARAVQVTRAGSPRLCATRRRLGVLLVEAGFHLIARADRTPLPAPLPR